VKQLTINYYYSPYTDRKTLGGSYVESRIPTIKNFEGLDR